MYVKTTKQSRKGWGFPGRGFKGDFVGTILILEQYVKRIVITNYHSKFQLNSSKRLEVILLRKMNENEGTWGVLGG